MKTKKQYFSLFVILTAFLGTTFAQKHFEAMNMQAHTNRQDVTIAQKNAMRDEGTVVPAAYANPCASIAAIEAAASEAGYYLRQAEVSRAEIVRQVLAQQGYTLGNGPITWDNFKDVQPVLDAHTVQLRATFVRPLKDIEIGGTIWSSSGVFQGADWDKTIIQGTHGFFAWDFRAETGKSNSVFLPEMDTCCNPNGKDVLLAIYNGTARIYEPAGAYRQQPANDEPMTAEELQFAEQGMARVQQMAASAPAGTIIFAPIMFTRGGSANIEESGNSGGCCKGGSSTEASALVPEITFHQAPTEMLPAGTSATVQIAPGMAGYVTPVGTAANVSGSMVYGNAVAPAAGGNTYISTFPVNGNGRPKANPAEIVMATNSTLNTIMHGAEFFGADNAIQNKLGTNQKVNVNTILTLLTGGTTTTTDGGSFQSNGTGCPVGSTWNPITQKCQ